MGVQISMDEKAKAYIEKISTQILTLYKRKHVSVSILDLLEKIEEVCLNKALKKCKNKSDAALLLNLKRTTFLYRLKK